jgi:hypothetical protein
MVDLESARSFLPATKKLIGASGRFIAAAMASGEICEYWICRRQAQLRIARDDGASPQTWLLSSCGCLRVLASTVTLYGAVPAVGQFLFEADRIVIGPEVETEYAGQPVTRFCLISPADGRRQYVFADADTLLPLAVVVE